jgi:hypothetical protein
MGWETRGTRRYYYRKRREGQRVVSEYVGTSSSAALIAESDALLRVQSWGARKQRTLEIQQLRDADQEINRLLDLCSSLTSAALIIAGYHTHKGQWRRKHGT